MSAGLIPVPIASTNHLLRSSPSLSSLSLESCRVPADTLLHVCRACPLTSLNVAESAAAEFDDATLREVAVTLPRLLSLELRGCTGVTGGGIEALVARCVRLVVLGLGGCSVEREAVAAARTALPACDIYEA